ncbi:MAG: GNAT family N-acetyltransferase [Acetivibrionales bacterium]|jgi:ribosomal-protein-alanine N-acetyltransferase
MDVLESERLILRPFKEDDLDDFYEYAKNPNVGPNAGWKPHDSKEESSEILKEFMEKDEVWAIADRKTNRVIGSIGLHHDRKRDNKKAKMLGYVLAEPYWGKGLATEAAKRVIQYAFEELELDLLSVYHYPFNNRSKRVIEKCGFHYEGTIRGASTLYDGSVCDDVCYSMTRQEYISSKTMLFKTYY